MSDPVARPIRVQDIAPSMPAAGAGLLDGRIDLIKDVKVTVRANLGLTELSVKELFELKPESVLTLDARIDDLIEVELNGRVIARGELIAVDDCFGVRITEILQP